MSSCFAAAVHRAQEVNCPTTKLLIAKSTNKVPTYGLTGSVVSINTPRGDVQLLELRRDMATKLVGRRYSDRKTLNFNLRHIKFIKRVMWYLFLRKYIQYCSCVHDLL